METLAGAELCFPHLLNTSCRKPMHPPSEAILLYILLSSVSLIAVVLNLLVIISISHYRQLHTPTNILLLSLAISDLLTGLQLPGEILIKETCWLIGDIMCTVAYLDLFTIVSVSVGNMVLISVDRYVAICDPLCYPTKVTPGRVKICVFLCWGCAFLYSSLILMDHLTHPGRYNSCVGECVAVIGYTAEAVDLVFSFIVPITVIIVLYMRVFVVAVSQARAMRSHIAAVTLRVSVTAKKSERKAARTLGIVIAVFLICFSPYYCLSLAGQNTFVSASSVVLVDCLFYVNSCLNPVIYAFFYPWFRKAIKHIVTLQILQPHSCEANIL
ncbi:trace amine-associated receptor 13c-like [Centroberyx affinis]|uniref:trace amine-associated receptor 13c-like n=1 Tax=Centroberyx affinis TaxID=166261 RepID=UPI003A5B9C99